MRDGTLFNLSEDAGVQMSQLGAEGAQLGTGSVSERRNFISKLIKSMSFADMARIKCVFNLEICSIHSSPMKLCNTSLH